MNDSRTKIFAKLADKLAPFDEQTVNAELAALSPPSISLDCAVSLQDLLINHLRAHRASVEQVNSDNEIVGAIANFLQEQHLAKQLHLPIAEDLKNFHWQQAGISIVHDILMPSTAIALTRAQYGVAESGSLIFAGQDADENLYNFLPDTHIVLLRAQTIVASYEQVIQQLDQDLLSRRVLNIITGPSRTADIEQTMYLGMHGPRQLHVIMIMS